MKLSQFFEQVYVPTYLADAAVRTVDSYRESVRKADEILGEPTIQEVNLYANEFIKVLKEKGLEPATIAKHCRHLNSIFLKLGPTGHRNRDAKKILDYTPYFHPPKFRIKTPRVFTDSHFQSLFNAFSHETEYPRYLPCEKRPLFWQTMMVFVSIIAVRREVVLGIKWRDIDRDELLVHVRPEIDKKDQDRFKPIKPVLIEYLELIRPHHVNWNSNCKVFEWGHGNGCWYDCWHKAEDIAGVKMGLHDLKRFSGTLALRAGADALKLQKHMDHTNISTTLKHYCQPETRDLVDKIIVPIPGLEPTPPAPITPTPSEKELVFPTAPGFKFKSVYDVHEYYLKEMERMKESSVVAQTSNGTILTILNENKEETHVNESPTPHPPNKDIRNGNSAG